MKTICVAAAVATIAIASEAMAEDAPKAPPAKEHVRVDLGMGFANLGGPSGWMPWPTASIGVEGHLGGPVWLFTAASGTYSESEGDGGDGKGGYVDGSLGLRVEAPVFRWLEMGGFAMARAAYWESVAGDIQRDRSRSFGGAIGASAHFRPTRFFGVRLALEALRVDHQEWGSETEVPLTHGGTQTVSWGGRSTTVGLTPSPSVALTFTF